MKYVQRTVTTLLTFVLIIALMVPAAPVQAAKEVKLNKTSVELSVGESVKLKLSNATASEVSWTSSKKSVAKVSSIGKVTAKKTGSATIKAKYNNKTYRCKVTVSGSSSASSSQSRSVYITATGSKYHSINNCGRTNPSNTTKMSEEDAIARGYSKCSRCF
jgi:uncharacterized protein YjdB